MRSLVMSPISYSFVHCRTKYIDGLYLLKFIYVIVSPLLLSRTPFYHFIKTNSVCLYLNTFVDQINWRFDFVQVLPFRSLSWIPISLPRFYLSVLLNALALFCTTVSKLIKEVKSNSVIIKKITLTLFHLLLLRFWLYYWYL